MKPQVCSSCGASEIRRIGGQARCAYCGTAFASEAGSAVIDLADDVARLLEKCEADPANARRYANLALDIDPGNAGALRYL